jgi:hypothetical protein
MAIPRNLANLAPKLDSSGNPTFTAPTVFSAGTASDPSITFTGDTNTGLFCSLPQTRLLLLRVAQRRCELRVMADLVLELPHRTIL